MSLNRLVALALAGLLVAPSLAEAKKKKTDDEEESSDDDSDEDTEKPAKKKAKAEKADKSDEDSDDDSASDDDSSDQDDSEDETPKKKKKKTDDEDGGDTKASDEETGDKPVKQDLSGHDLGTQKKENEFEKDRFYVDKVDTEKTEKGTLVQGSLQSTTFLYKETGGDYKDAGVGLIGQGNNYARFSRVYTDFRLQTDFRHISGGKWDARIDARARLLLPADNSLPTGSMLGSGNSGVDPNRVQSGFKGTNEYDLRELWLYRSGKRSDLFIGRQFIPDLAGVKFDGLRVDYAQSKKFTYIGFGGLYPYRGSRSITTDYPDLRNDNGQISGRVVGAGGFGAAYRTLNTYGAFGGVLLYPVSGEQARLFGTSTGYYRYGSLLDFYHFALLDAYSSQGTGLTNLSAGVNFKPNARLRMTGAFNRVDVDTLAVQANAFLKEPTGATTIESETYFRRLATNTARATIAAGLGEMQRFELAVNASYRQRGSISIPYGPVMADGTQATETLQGSKGAEIGGSFIDRRSYKGMRLGIDTVRTLKLGDATQVAFQRSEIFAVRVFGSRELENGHGEWEAEVAYTSTKDSSTGTTCDPGQPIPTLTTCYGSSKNTILSAGGTLFYRINTNWMLVGSIYLTRQSLHAVGNALMGAASPTSDDPPITGFTGFGRIAYRF